jgi:hypothetical protein
MCARVSRPPLVRSPGLAGGSVLLPVLVHTVMKPRRPPRVNHKQAEAAPRR